MTVLVDGTLPWTAAEVDLDRALAELRARFPGLVVWHGEYTSQWWALARDCAGYDVLIEGGNPAELGRQLEVVRSRSYRNAGGRVPTSRLISSPTMSGWPPEPVTASTPSVVCAADPVKQQSPATRCGGRHKKSSKRRLLGRVIELLIVRHVTKPDQDHERHPAGRAAIQMELVR